MTEPEIELVEDEEGMHLTLRGQLHAAYAERAAVHGVTVEQLAERVLRDALADGRL